MSSGMPVCVATIAAMLISTVPRAMSVQGPTIRHTGIEYVSTRQFPRIEVDVDFPLLVRSAKLYFRAEQYTDFYYVEMVRDDDDSFVAILPIPIVQTAAIVYFIEITDTAFNPIRSPVFRAQVTTQLVPGASSSQASINVGSTGPQSPELPPGFREDGIQNVITPEGDLRPVSQETSTPEMSPDTTAPEEGGGGGGGTAVAIVLGAGAAAGVGYLVMNQQEEDPPPREPDEPMADVSVEKAALVSGTVPAGQPFSYELRITNGGPDVATNVELVDDVPGDLRITDTDPEAGITCDISGQTVRCSAPSLSVGQTLRVEYDVFPRDPSVTVTNRVRVSATERDPNPGNNDDSATTTIGAPPVDRADVGVIKLSTLSGNATQGVPFGYVLRVTNGGPERATEIQVSDTVPSGLRITDTTFPSGASCGVAGQIIRCSGASLSPGASLDINYVVVADQAPLTATNRVEVTAREDDPNSGNNTASVTTMVDAPSVADIIVRVTYIGSNRFRVDLSNAGPTGTVPDIDLVVESTGVEVDFNASTVSSSGFTSGCPRPAFGNELFNCGTSLGPKQSASLTFTASPRREGILEITAYTLACETIDPNCRNNRDSDNVQIVFLQEQRQGAMLLTGFFTQLETSSSSPATGEMAMDGEPLGSVTSGSPRSVPVRARAGEEKVIEAWTTSQASGEGRWEFSFQGARYIVPGSPRVEAGQLLSSSGDRLVFRLSGAAGERLRFRVRVDDR